MDLIRKKFLQISSSRPGCLILIALSFVPALAVMGLIYFFSSQNAALSSELSYPITEELIHALDRLFSLELSEAELIAASGIYHSFVRKLAHLTEYAALAVTLYLPVRLGHIPCPRISAWCFCLVYAALDEFHQRFSSEKPVF
ncbi:MAG: VanZ family protein [Eisenbergiella sp.]